MPVLWVNWLLVTIGILPPFRVWYNGCIPIIKADVVNESWTTVKVENNNINLQSTQVQKLLGTKQKNIKIEPRIYVLYRWIG